MSSADTKTARDLARDTRSIIAGTAAQLGGKARGPDHGPDRRVPRRDSYDVEDPRAKPWARIGKGTVAEGLAHREALLQAAEDRYHQDWKEMPGRQVRETRAELDRSRAELALITAGADAPVGRAGALRIAIEKLGVWLDRAKMRLRLVDLAVLKAVVCKIDFATGAMFPSIERIAADAGCHRNSVVTALRRLRAHGFLAWVRRSIRTGNDGAFAPQREQTSNAYYFDHRRQMTQRTWSRFLQLLTAKLRRAGSVPAALAPPPEPPSADALLLRSAIASLGASIPNAST